MLAPGPCRLTQLPRHAEAHAAWEESLRKAAPEPRLFFPSTIARTRQTRRWPTGWLACAGHLTTWLSACQSTAQAIGEPDGVLGVPVWVALAALTDWRWLLECDDSPVSWMRLFRQSVLGRAPVFDRMTAEIQILPRSATASRASGSAASSGTGSSRWQS